MSFRRNLVVIFTHGLRSDTLGDYAAWPLKCPHFLKLSLQGIRLVSTSCSPADPDGMTSLYTGLHVRQQGQHALEPRLGDTQLSGGWPSLLADEGYHLAGAGRVGPIVHWLDQSVCVEDVSRTEAPTCAYLKHVASRGMLNAILAQRKQRLRYGPFDPDRLLLEPDDDIDGFIGAQGASLIEQMPTGEPWSTIISFTGPGNELPPPSLYDGLVDPSSLMQDFAPVDLSQVNHLVELDYPRTLLQRLDAYQIGRIRADYLGRVSLIDHALSRILRAISNRPDASRTWVVLASDRGMLLGEKGLVGHRSFLAPVVETPAIIAPPLTGKIPAEPHHHEGLISNVDIAATIASLAGCDLPAHTTGRSLLPLLNGLDTEPRASQLCCLSEFGQRLMIETARYKTIFSVENRNVLALYDLLKDPYEQQNIMDQPLGMDMIDTMRMRLGDALLPLRCVAV